MRKMIVIGIAGGSASGKTSISEQLKEHYEDTRSVVIMRQDDYYKDQSHMVMEERVKTNYDHPFAFDNDLLVSQLKALMAHEEIQKPTYDFVEHTRSKIIETIEPSDVLVLEGLFVLENEELRNLCDIKIFVDTDADLRFIRRLVRDMHNQFVEPSKRYADIIIPEGGKNVVAIDLLLTKISSIIYGNMV